MYIPDENRYGSMPYRRCGESGLKLPSISLGLWQNFGDSADYDEIKDIILTAFDMGVTHFDLANNYGPAPGAAEINFGKIFEENLRPYRDELIISTKAGYEMWAGPYGGKGGSRKYLTASLDQSLKRMGLEYVDIFYHHCMDAETPLEETALTLSDICRQGKALYAGISNYDGHRMHKMHHRCEDYNVPFIINQNRYSLFDRSVWDNGLRKQSMKKGKGLITFSPLAQGMLSDKYALGKYEGARLYNNGELQKKVGFDDKRREQLKKLYEIAHDRGETVSQLAIQWLLADKAVTSVLIGVRSKAQLLENLAALSHPALTEEEFRTIGDLAK